MIDFDYDSGGTMRITRLAGYIGAGMMAVSCSVKPASEKALEHASKYLKGSELVVAEDRAAKITKTEAMNYSHDIFYWDSLLSVNREKEFINKGKQYVLDGVNGKLQRKEVFSMPIQPSVAQSGESILFNAKKEVAKYYTGEEFLALERKAPNNSTGNKWGTSENYRTHYFGELSIVGAERRGYYKGIQIARDSIENVKASQ